MEVRSFQDMALDLSTGWYIHSDHYMCVSERDKEKTLFIYWSVYFKVLALPKGRKQNIDETIAIKINSILSLTIEIKVQLLYMSNQINLEQQSYF